MSKLIDILQPKRIIDSKKIRLGPKEDKGCVICDKAARCCSALFTYGVGDFLSYPRNIGFERSFVDKYKKPAYLFDHTLSIKEYQDKNNLIKFFPQGLGPGPDCDTFFNHYKQLNISGKVLLKIDIEGGEYDFFENTDTDEIAKLVSCLCIEFHDLDNNIDRYINIGEKINKNFLLNHIHGNNYKDYFNYKGYDVPKVLELTFVNKIISNNYIDCTESYPIDGLDYPNNPNTPDLDLCFIHKNKIITKYSPSVEKKMTRDTIYVGVGDYPTQNIKTIFLSKKYKNPRFYPRKLGNYPDTFSVEYKEDQDQINVKRTDANISWGLPLIIDVEFDAESDSIIKTNTTKQLIPKVIYQTYKTNKIPPGMHDAVNSWINNNQDYEHYFFTDEDCYEFIEKNFDSRVLSAYINLIPGAFKADLWRCCVLYIKGGVYIDSDMMCLEPLSKIINSSDEFVSVRDDPMSKKFIYNAFIACIPKHPFLKEQIDAIVKNVENKNVCYYLDISGPALLGKSINKICARDIDTEFSLGESVINNLKLKLLEHDWKSKTIKLGTINAILTEYPEKNNEMKQRNIISYYDLYQQNIVYQQIPRNIYFTTNDSIYINEYMVKSFESKNKFWKLNYYSDKDCVMFFEKENTRIKELLGVDALSVFANLQNGGERSDFWRYCIIYLYGGFYTDADTYCNISLDQWIKHYDLILGIEALLPEDEARTFGMDKIGKTYGNSVISVCNWTFAAKKEHPFLKDLILDIAHHPIQSNVLLNTGPGRFTKHAMEYFGHDIQPLQEHRAIVKNASILFDINKFGSNQSHSNAYKNYDNPLETIDSAYIVHLFDGSWRCKKNQDIKKYKSNLGVSHNLTLDKINENEYIGVARLDKDTSRTQFLKKTGDCRTLLEIKFDRNLDIIEEKEKPILNFDACAKFEDYRVFYFQNKKFYSVSYIDIEFNTKVAILDQNFTFLGDVILSDRKFNTAWNKIWEKNWLFFEHNNDLYFIYSTTPRYILYKCINFDKLIFKTHIDIEWQFHGPTDNLYFGDKVTTGGSVNPIYLKEKNIYLYMIHTKIYNKRRYNHYFVALDNNAKPIKFYDRPLINEYTQEGYFFISSMILESEYILISGGLEDNQNFTWRLSKDFIFKKIIN